MAENIPTPQSEEVDLGKLFQVIGNGFKKLFERIGQLFTAIFHYGITFLIFIRKHFIKLAAATILGGVFGYVLEMDDVPQFYSDIIIETNFGSGHQLYNQTKQLNTLISNKNLDKLVTIFNISKDEAASLITFDAAPYRQENNLLKEYDYFLQHTDTVFTRNFLVEDFAKRFEFPDYKFQKMTVIGTNKDVFPKLDKGIMKLVENEHYLKILSLKNREFTQRRKILEESLEDIKKLRKRYDEVAILAATNTSASGTTISLSEKQGNRNKDIDLFSETKRLLVLLDKLDENQIREGFIISTISNFNIGKTKDGLLSHKWLKYALLFASLMFLGILGLKLNTYLNKYQK